MSSYDKCKKKYIEKIIKEYEGGKLKTNSGKKVKDRKQAIAIALSIAQKKCKITDKSLKAIEKKVRKFLVEDNRKISLERIPLTNVIETRLLIKNLIKDKKKSKAKKYSILLKKRIQDAEKKGISRTDNINSELRKVSRMVK